MNDKENNLKALQFLEKGKFAISQDLFKRNAARYPSYITYNNLGRYFAEFGNERKDGRVVNASKLAFRYLKKSLELKPNILANRNLAYFSYELYLYKNESLNDAEMYQSEVLKYRYNYEDVYNYSVILYELEQYDRGFNVLEKVACNLPESRLLYLLYLLKLGKLSQNTVNIYEKLISSLDLYEQQFFYYNCKDYARVVSITESFLTSHFYIDDNSLALYIDSLLVLFGMSEIKRQKDKICEKTAIDGKVFIEFVNNGYKRNSVIERYELKVIMQSICGFYGCHIHNTEWEI